MSRKHDSAARRRHLQHAFTLVELLVVIAIIALLISLLLPALGAAKGAARTAQCASNLHQLLIATEMYRGDSKQYFPRPVDTTTGTTLTSAQAGTAMWFNALDYYLSVNTKSYSAGNTSERNYVIFKHDPISKDSTITSASLGENGNRTIKMNQYFRDDAPGDAFAKDVDLRRTEAIVLFLDGRAQDIRPSDTGTAGQFSITPGTAGLRHGGNKAGVPFSGGANVAFTDGSVRLITQKVRTDTAAPAWHTENIASPGTDDQDLAWRLFIP